MQSFRQYRRIEAHVSAAASLQQPSEVPPGSQAVTEHDPKNEAKVGATTLPFVDWDPSDKHLAPRNWSTARRTATFIIIWVNCFAVDWPATADAGTSGKAAEHFHQNKWAACLGAALYTFGIAVGALFAGPI